MRYAVGAQRTEGVPGAWQLPHGCEQRVNTHRVPRIAAAVGEDQEGTAAARSASRQQTAAAQHMTLQRAEDQQIDGDAHQQDQEDREEHRRHAAGVAAVLQQLAQADEGTVAKRLRDVAEPRGEPGLGLRGAGLRAVVIVILVTSEVAGS